MPFGVTSCQSQASSRGQRRVAFRATDPRALTGQPLLSLAWLSPHLCADEFYIEPQGSLQLHLCKCTSLSDVPKVVSPREVSSPPAVTPQIFTTRNSTL